MPFLVYSVQRLALFGAALLALAWLHLGGWLLVVVAAFLAWAVSYLALAGPRDRAALWVSERVERRRTGPRFGAGVEADAAEEDAEAGEWPGAVPVSGARVGGAPDGGAPDGGASDGEAEAEQHAVPELEQSRAGEDGPEQDTASAGEDGRGEQAHREGEQQREQ